MPVIAPSHTAASAIGLSGLRAAQTQLDTAAHNVANARTPGFQRHRVEQSALPESGGVTTRVTREANPPGGDGVALADDLVTQRQALYSFAANLKTIETEERLLGGLLDTRA